MEIGGGKVSPKETSRRPTPADDRVDGLGASLRPPGDADADTSHVWGCHCSCWSSREDARAFRDASRGALDPFPAVAETIPVGPATIPAVSG